jgi:hypothetical protein
MRKSYGFRTFRCLELALYHSRITSQVLEDMLGVTEGGLGIDHPEIQWNREALDQGAGA